MKLKKPQKDEVTRIIEDFQVEDATKAKQDSPFLLNLMELWEMAYEKHKPMIEKIKDMKKPYVDERVPDYYGAADVTLKDNRHLFKGEILNKVTRLFASFLLKEKPIWNSDPILTEDHDEQLKAQFEKLGWIIGALEEVGAVEIIQDNQNPNAPPIPQLVDPEKAKGFWNTLIDQNTERWFHSDNMTTETSEIIVIDAVLTSVGYGAIRILDDKPGAWPGTGPHIVFEPVPPQNVIEDPEADNRADARMLYHIRVMEVREVAKLYDVDPDELNPIEEFSEIKDTHVPGINEDDSMKYKIKRVLVVDVYMKDDTKLSISIPDETGYVHELKVPVYPNGRKICFLPQQKNDSGIMILSDEPEKIVGGPIHSFLPDPISQLRGRAPAQGVINISNVADKAMQQGLSNLESVGNYMIFHEEGDSEAIRNLSNRIAQKVSVSRADGVNISRPQAIMREAIELFIFCNKLASEIMGINETGEGKIPSNVTSGKQLQILNSRISQIMQLPVNHWASFLTRVGISFVSAFLLIAKTGKKVVWNDKIYSLPVDLSDFVAGANMFVAPDTLVPRDQVSQSNAIMALADMRAEDGMPIVTREAALDALRIDGKEKIMADAEKAGGLLQQLEQAMQQNEQLIARLDEMGKELEKAAQQAEKDGSKQQASMMKMQQENMKQEWMTLRQKLDDQAELQKANMAANASITKELIKARSAASAGQNTPSNGGAPVVGKT